ncbi:MAG: hypothetical protein OHK0037_01950 [Elainellaceae cyanobacterium]
MSQGALQSQLIGNQFNSRLQKILRRSLSLAIALPLLLSSSATSEEIEFSDAAERMRELSDGPIQLRLTYGSNAETWSGELRYEVFYNGKREIEQTQESSLYGAASLQDLDADGVAEVIIRTYSGGAHCCTTHTIHSWQGDRFTTTDTGFRDGEGGSFQDLDGDGQLEFVSVDNAFLYAFSSYAGSFPPSQIWTLQNGQFVDVTRQHPEELRAIANQMREAVLTIQSDTNEVNGILAGYVAQMILLGKQEQGWAFMLANYDRTSDWGLEIYEGERAIGRHPGFPAALKAFLIEQGYLTADGSAAP